jgi:hypothetical protein
MWDKTAPRRLPDGTLALVPEQYDLQGNSPVACVDDRRADCVLRLSLYPLPPPEPGTLSVVSPDLGAGHGRCPLDGRAIVTAAAHTRPS